MPEKRIDILLVEDNIDDAAFLTHALEEGSVNVALLTARDGVEALRVVYGEDPSPEVMPRIRPRLILLDLKLPRLGGLQVLGRLKGNPHSRSIPVIVLSSSLEQSDLEQAYALGANSYLVKPMDFDAFSEQIKTLVDYWLQMNQTVDV